MKTCTNPSCGATYENPSSGFCERCGDVLEESAANLVGQTLDGKYRVEGFIAQGGMGAVYQAYHILLGDKVVIKTMRRELQNNSEFLRRFQREGRAARAFQHPNSVTVYDLSTTPDGLIYMVMEFVAGHTLDKELKRRERFSPQEAIAALDPVASVLDAAHARGVVHRDLKPENVMLGLPREGSRDTNAIVKVLDLGIAKMTGSESVPAATNITVIGQILGTPYYMSPEQWGETPRDGSMEVDGRADVYSLGVMFYELVTGQKPLGGNTLAELRERHLTANFKPLVTLAPDAGDAFGAAVQKAMARDRSDRFNTAGELIRELKQSVGLSAYEPLTPLPFVPTADTKTDYTETSSTARTITTTEPLTKIQDQSRSTSGGQGRATVVDSDNRSTSANAGGDRYVGGRETAVDMSVGRQTQGGDGYQITNQQTNGGYVDGEGTGGTAVKPNRTTLYVGGGLFAVAVLAAGTLGIYKMVDTKVGPSPAPTAVVNPNGTGTMAASNEVMQFWLEKIDPKSPTAAGERRTGEVIQMKSGDKFLFNFKARDKGYIYIIGPGIKNAPTTFITAIPDGADTNAVNAGGLYKFPRGNSTIELDNNIGREAYTVIYSPTPLTSPGFLTQKAGKELSIKEVGDLDNLKSTALSAQLKVSDGSGAQPYTSVMLPSANQTDKPFVFEIQIDHR